MRKTEYTVASNIKQFQVGTVFEHYFGEIGHHFVVKCINTSNIIFDVYTKTNRIIPHLRANAIILEDLSLKHWIKIGFIKDYEKMDDNIKKLLYHK